MQESGGYKEVPSSAEDDVLQEASRSEVEGQVKELRDISTRSLRLQQETDLLTTEDSHEINHIAHNLDVAEKSLDAPPFAYQELYQAEQMVADLANKAIRRRVEKITSFYNMLISIYGGDRADRRFTGLRVLADSIKELGKRWKSADGTDEIIAYAKAGSPLQMLQNAILVSAQQAGYVFPSDFDWNKPEVTRIDLNQPSVPTEPAKPATPTQPIAPNPTAPTGLADTSETEPKPERLTRPVPRRIDQLKTAALDTSDPEFAARCRAGIVKLSKLDTYKDDLTAWLAANPENPSGS